MNMNHHPCFESEAKHTHARVHLPVAPRCNVQCNFCDRQFSCANESRPGVTSAVISPFEAIAHLDRMMELIPNISVAGIAGPGDPFANACDTMETLRLVRERYPEILLCIATNGLNLYEHIPALDELKTSHVTITVNAVDPVIGGKVYSWMRFGKRTLQGETGAGRLWEEQKQSILELKKRNIIVKINSVYIPGINDGHMMEISRTVSELGADIMNILPLHPVHGTPFGKFPEPSESEILEIRSQARKVLPQMSHCTRCRADAAGLIGKETAPEIQVRPELPMKVAVASQEGLLINRHLGETDKFYIFSVDSDGGKWCETRKAPSAGSGDSRWNKAALILSDCSELWVSGIGSRPQSILEKAGIKSRELEGLIETGLRALAEGKSLSSLKKRAASKCGDSCGGSGVGCG